MPEIKLSKLLEIRAAIPYPGFVRTASNKQTNKQGDQSFISTFDNKDRRVFIYLFRVTLSVISMGENSCLPYCGYRFKYLRK